MNHSRQRAPHRPSPPAVPESDRFLTIRLTGDVEALDADLTQRTIGSSLSFLEPSTLVLDLEQVTHFAATGLRIIVTAWRQMQERGGHLMIAGGPPYSRHLLRRTGMTAVLDLYDTLDEIHRNASPGHRALADSPRDRTD
ncbi:STAS domain-containing protein [Spirillospora sp. NPDC047279]|uniref:STAS domain-containing protein n=1 Tax=Spirillospora sp. NPDC047279 TaxID=3155478 RepID=UPI0033E6827A